MPELSRFFDIIVRMYMELGGQHNTPRLHAYYQNEVAVMGISPIELIAGTLPRRQQRLLEAWAEVAPNGTGASLDTPPRRSPTDADRAATLRNLCTRYIAFSRSNMWPTTRSRCVSMTARNE